MDYGIGDGVNDILIAGGKLEYCLTTSGEIVGSDWVGVGYTDKDLGAVMSVRSADLKKIFITGSTDPALSIPMTREVMFKVRLLQVTRESFAIATGGLPSDAANGFYQGGKTARPQLLRWRYVIPDSAGGRIIYIPKGRVVEMADAKFSDNTETGLEVTIQAEEVSGIESPAVTFNGNSIMGARFLFENTNNIFTREERGSLKSTFRQIPFPSLASDIGWIDVRTLDATYVDIASWNRTGFVASDVLGGNISRYLAVSFKADALAGVGIRVGVTRIDNRPTTRLFSSPLPNNDPWIDVRALNGTSLQDVDYTKDGFTATAQEDATTINYLAVDKELMEFQQTMFRVVNVTLGTSMTFVPFAKALPKPNYWLSAYGRQAVFPIEIGTMSREGFYARGVLGEVNMVALAVYQEQ